MDLELPMDKFLRSFRTKLVLPHVYPQMKICDLGCGINPILLGLLSRVVANKSVGIDICVQNSCAPNIELRTADLNKSPLPINDKEFDCITALAVLEHLDNYDEFIGECYRGLKNAGKLFVTTPSLLAKPILECLAKLGIISKTAIADHKKYFTKSELFILLQKHGFNNIKIWAVACGLNTVVLAEKNHVLVSEK